MSQRASTSLLFMPNLRRQRWNTLEAERHGNQRRTEIPQVFLFPMLRGRLIVYGCEEKGTVLRYRCCDQMMPIQTRMWVCLFEEICKYAQIIKRGMKCVQFPSPHDMHSVKSNMVKYGQVWTHTATQPHGTSFTLAA